MFRPMLATNDQVELELIVYPQMASYKRDGVRCIFRNGRMLTRKFKEIQNIELHKKFAYLKDWSKANPNTYLDGELYSHEMSFNELSGVIRRKQCAVPQHLMFKAFDLYFVNYISRSFKDRNILLKELVKSFNKNSISAIEQVLVKNPTEVRKLFDKALADGYEGLILKNPLGYYKRGRTTNNENLMYKVKPYLTFDSKIIEVLQATVVNADAPKKVNELGRSVTSKKKGDRVLIPMASAFRVLHEGKELDVSIAMTKREKTIVWGSKENFIGRTIEYKGLMVGAKDLPRHPVFLRFREDKD